MNNTYKSDLGVTESRNRRTRLTSEGKMAAFALSATVAAIGGPALYDHLNERVEGAAKAKQEQIAPIAESVERQKQENLASAHMVEVMDQSQTQVLNSYRDEQGNIHFSPSK